MADFDFDAVVVGAGAVGLACGYALSQRGLTTAVLEQGPIIGEGVSARNSEVIHGGLYYPTGSLKARLCVQGRRALYAFLDSHKVAYDRCGKLVVATSEEELGRLDAILEQARANDVEGMDRLTRAQALDADTPGEGWTCFGDSGLTRGPALDNAPWLGAWAPGGREAVQPRGFGVLLKAGTQIVMQVHYNLLAGTGPDASSTLLRLAPADRAMTSVETMLLPAPVELPCRPDHADGPLCDRDAAVADVAARFGADGATANLLHLLCGQEIVPGNTQSCTRTITQPTTIRAVAGHMHLLGRAITIKVNPGTPRERTVLDIPLWNFDDQGARPIKPVHLHMFDKVEVTCRHVQWLRDRLPAFAGQPDKYVVWGDGTTDEMCLGILQVTHP